MFHVLPRPAGNGLFRLLMCMHHHHSRLPPHPMALTGAGETAEKQCAEAPRAMRQFAERQSLAVQSVGVRAAAGCGTPHARSHSLLARLHSPPTHHGFAVDARAGAGACAEKCCAAG